MVLSNLDYEIILEDMEIHRNEEWMEKCERDKEELTCSNPHPVGMNARMHTIMSWKVICGTAIKVIRAPRKPRKINPFIKRNTSWRVVLYLFLPKYAIWENENQHSKETLEYKEKLKCITSAITKWNYRHYHKPDQYFITKTDQP